MIGRQYVDRQSAFASSPFRQQLQNSSCSVEGFKQEAIRIRTSIGCPRNRLDHHFLFIPFDHLRHHRMRRNALRHLLFHEIIRQIAQLAGQPLTYLGMAFEPCSGEPRREVLHYGMRVNVSEKRR